MTLTSADGLAEFQFPVGPPYVTDSLVALWTTEVAPGDASALYDAENSNDLTQVAGSPTKTTSAGFRNEGVDYAEGDAYYASASDAKWNPSSLTVVFWLNDTVDDTYTGHVVGKDNTNDYGTSGWGVDNGPSGNVFRATVRQSDLQEVVGEFSSGSTGTWYLIFYRLTSSTGRVEAFDTNGSSVFDSGSVAISGHDSGTATYFEISQGSGGNGANQVDEVHFYNKELSDTERDEIVTGYTG